MKNNVDKTDAELKSDVLSELKYEPDVKITDIGILVENGAVTLNGYATSYGEKSAAVRAAKRVAGVRAIADDIEVKLPDSLRRTHGDIAAAAANQIGWSATVPTETVAVTVRNGWITLEGEVEWQFQKIAAENVVQHLWGVTGVNNYISIKPKLSILGIETAIKAALERNAGLDDTKIHVETSGDKVVLHGTVGNYAEQEEASRVAWSAEGVSSVDNQLTVHASGLTENATDAVHEEKVFKRESALRG